MARKMKTFCFFCNYEICDEKHRTVQYKNVIKKVCFFCTPSQHKACRLKFKDCQIDCQLCQKPVKFNKCVKCFLCNHLIHAKCNDLSPKDLKLIEAYDSFACKSCTKLTYPFGTESDSISTTVNAEQAHSKKPVTHISHSQCFTCTNSIDPRKRYRRKHIIYDDKKGSLCEQCSDIGVGLPVRDVNKLEFLTCSVCSLDVKYQGILCDTCKCWNHPDCNDIDNVTLNLLSNANVKWQCQCCNGMIDNGDKTKNCLFETFTDCSICTKQVKTNISINCSICMHWVHAKCIDNFKRNEFKCFNDFYKDRDWYCPKCLSLALPFTELDNKDFYIFCLETKYNTKLTTNMIKNICHQLNSTSLFEKISYEDDISEKHDFEGENLDPSKYFDRNDTCKYIFNLGDITWNKKSLSILSFNIRSIRFKFKALVNMISSLDTKVDIISISETWLTNNDNILDFQLNNYHPPIYYNRETKKNNDSYNIGGGVVTYFHESISVYKLNKSISINDSKNHYQVIDFEHNHKKCTYINCYRSPQSDGDDFNIKLESIISKTKNRKCYLAGDFNLNLLNLAIHNKTEEYYNMLVANSFKPIITIPTRVTEHSQTIIDHIWTNDLTIDKISGYVHVTDLSDHLPCIAVFNTNEKYEGYRHITSRNLSDGNRETFRKSIHDAEDKLINICNDESVPLQDKYDTYFKHIKNTYNECFPIRTRKVHEKTFRKPWITESILKDMEKRNKAFGKKSKSRKAKAKYKELKEDVETKLEASRTKYYRERLSRCSDNIKNKWDVIREIINRKTSKSNELPIGNSELGQHYSSVAKKLAQSIPHLNYEEIATTSKSSFSKKETNKIFTFRETSKTEIYETILQLDVNKGPGVDELDIKSIKYIADIISPHLAILFNESLYQSIYPDNFKLAKCVPIFKGADLDPLNPVNYRPISILNSINKVFERIIHRQMYLYLETNNLLPDFQYGYRKKHNTSQAILDFTNTIINNRKQKLASIAVFMDLSKAFDTVDKVVLINKMNKLGFDNGSQNLIYNYLCERSFCFSDQTGITYKLDYGVPQGSILGPLLFIIYTYDLKHLCPNDKSIVYADDTTIIISGRNIYEASQKCNSVLHRFVEYFQINKLSINPDKTKYMVYSPKTKHKRNNTMIIDITMNGKAIEQVNSIKFLGVIINKSLSWEEHKQYTQRKIAKSIGIIYNCKDILSESELINIYKTFIQSNLLYAIEVWGHTVISESDILTKMQNKVLRIMFNFRRTEDAWRYSNNRIQNVKELYKNTITRICLKHHYNQLPQYFSTYILPPKNDLICLTDCGYNLRSNEHKLYNYKQVFNNKLIFTENCIDMWNGMPLEFKQKPYLK